MRLRRPAQRQRQAGEGGEQAQAGAEARRHCRHVSLPLWSFLSHCSEAPGMVSARSSKHNQGRTSRARMMARLGLGRQSKK